MFALYINESQAVPFYEGHNPIFTWIWELIHMKNAPFSFRYFSFLFSDQNCFFAYVQFEVFLPLLLSMLFGPKKGKVVLVVIFAVVFGGVRVNLVAGYCF